jgi:hypothetical protein
MKQQDKIQNLISSFQTRNEPPRMRGAVSDLATVLLSCGLERSFVPDDGVCCEQELAGDSDDGDF